MIRQQQTLKQPVSFSGMGLHTGETVTLRFCPAKEDTGIVFQRVDLPNKPLIPATIDYAQESMRSTTIGDGQAVIHTVEHVLAALCAYQIDNLRIEITGIEPPVGEGNSNIFVQMIEKAGVEKQQKNIELAVLQEPVFYSEKNIHIIGLPSDEFKISYTLSYPKPKVLQAQYFSSLITPEIFKKEIAPARTFSLYEEITTLMDHGLIKGGSLSNAVVIKDDVILSKNGLYFSNEMARHKTLDVIGDLSLVGFAFQAHIIAICSGHDSNLAFAKKLFSKLTKEKESE